MKKTPFTARRPRCSAIWDTFTRWRDLERLDSQSLMTVQGGRKERKAIAVQLSSKGEKVAATLWTRLADPYLVVASRVKDWLFPLDPETIMERVHREYPEFRKTYTEPDTE